ncbi:MAG: hypothetical protein RMX96_21860 [Nostoc sp. ChiSLP02]|nr:hypothetical protein [Nostoc sp. DedSLP05]MDZ8097285.1 hypothetical protein [Nostoc sp. DedSLP01]MDZ8187481.1 hypothetical protein [Nostoc sp. ChiSLP02]
MSTVIDFARPKFRQGQKVEFLGGWGTIIQCCRNSGHWSYLVEMAMGAEPEMGRIGYETTILLFETDIALLEDYPFAA